MIDGKGDAAKALFQDSIQCLYKLSYSLRKVLKNEKPENYFDYVIPPLEALWWSVSAEFNPRKKSDWRWTLMMMQPPYISGIRVQQEIQRFTTVKSLPFKNCRFEVYDENLSVQIMHIGSYQEELPTLEKMSQFMRKNSLSPHLKHHEIYISDRSRTAEHKLRTILRRPVIKQI
ncbi:MAG: GyrI-like domain-containing protein [Calditrichaeota bacterium]|nr:GyrI-like domain-containing protein [Calditrichota bacterium]